MSRIQIISENDDSTVKIDNTKSEHKTFSFANDDFTNTVAKTYIKQENVKPTKKKWDI